jgi:hypothetical protein
LYCDTDSFGRVVTAYDSYIQGEGRERVSHLNEIAQKVKARYWQEVFPFISGPCWGVLTRPISTEEAARVPQICLRFFWESDLGMLTSDSGDMVYLRIEPTRRCDIFIPFSPLGTPIDVDFAETAMARYNWKRGWI